MRKLKYYGYLVSFFDHTRFVFTDEKQMNGIDIYKKKVYTYNMERLCLMHTLQNA